MGSAAGRGRDGSFFFTYRSRMTFYYFVLSVLELRYIFLLPTSFCVFVV